MANFKLGVLLVLCLISILPSAAQAGSGGSTGSGPASSNPAAKTSGKSSPQVYNDNDSLTSSWAPQQLKCQSGIDCAKLEDNQVNAFLVSMRKMGFPALVGYLSGYDSTTTKFDWPASSADCASLAGTAIILHIAFWKTDQSTAKTTLSGLAYSNWRGYRAFWDGKACSLKQPRSGDNSPLFYKTKRVLLIGLDLLQSAVDPKDAKLLYKTSTTPAVAQNVQDLGTLIEAITGAAPAVAKTVTAKPPLLNGFLTVADFDSTSAPPYTLNVSVSVGGGGGKTNSGGGSNSPAAAVDCTDAASKGCSITRQFSILDPEFWDVAVGVAVPGTAEAVYTASTTGGAPKLSLKHHTDAYAMVDLYPFSFFVPKESYFPHINFGVPLTSQSLHRPYFGLAENISLWAERKGFPLDVCVFGGLVDMKQQIISPASAGGLKWDRALKGIVGIELPVGQMASKLGGKKAKSSGASGSGNTSASGQ